MDLRLLLPFRTGIRAEAFQTPFPPFWNPILPVDHCSNPVETGRPWKHASWNAAYSSPVLQRHRRPASPTGSQNFPKGARIKPMGPIDLTPPGVPAPYSRQDRVAAGGCFWIMTEQADFMLFSLARVINPQKQLSGGVESRKAVRSS
ncbi:hypothetical protein CKAH01_07813 [Colletotrichum kahawae]|uniref:Uncharacterized protein n=1 Tax=Colletotrichum kahawae TaxID=34407 RepID=A0AAD9Y4Z8_COLKA|nr:hypothetical protein CKAH01_07813 [Colletotrichum kahawae]